MRFLHYLNLQSVRELKDIEFSNMGHWILTESSRIPKEVFLLEQYRLNHFIFSHVRKNRRPQRALGFSSGPHLCSPGHLDLASSSEQPSCYLCGWDFAPLYTRQNSGCRKMRCTVPEILQLLLQAKLSLTLL